MFRKQFFLVLLTVFFVDGHVIRDELVQSFLSRESSSDLKKFPSDSNVTYYSYHIHVYFLQNNENQSAEATTLRNRFLNRFNVTDCNDDCETWCPRICHWELNTAPIGPHPIGSWGIYVPIEQLIDTMAFISINHGNLTVLLHPNSGRPKIDHLLNAFWIKTFLPLDGDQLSDSAPVPPS